MVIKFSVYIATSLDGFIARRNGDIDWLPAPENNGEDFGYAEFMSSVDCLVMGRNTFEKVLTFGNWPYDRKVIVLSSRNLNIPSEIAKKAEALNLPPRELAQILAKRGMRHVYVDGGNTIQRFLADGLIDEMTITIIPILIGEGLPLFGAINNDINLELISSQSFGNGFVQNKYRVKG